MTNETQFRDFSVVDKHVRRKPSYLPLTICIMVVVIFSGLAVAFVYREQLIPKVSTIGSTSNGTIPSQPVMPASDLVGNSTIYPGSGIKNLKIGMPESVAEELSIKFDVLGVSEPEWQRTEPEFQRTVRRFHELGIFCYTKQGSIKSLGFGFRGGIYASYDGTTDKNIGMWSTVSDVRRVYGEPERLDKRGPSTGEHTYLMQYSSRGIDFFFRDAELAWITIYEPTQK